MSILTSPEFWTGVVSAIGAVTALVISLRTRSAVKTALTPTPAPAPAAPQGPVATTPSPVVRHDDTSNPWR